MKARYKPDKQEQTKWSVASVIVSPKTHNAIVLDTFRLIRSKRSLQKSMTLQPWNLKRGSSKMAGQAKALNDQG